ncbi:hypothetical protein [Citrobacter phage Ci1]|nr:hypothetical protein [Citrobacter phage Ci1]
MLNKRTSDKGSVFLYNNDVLLTYHNEKREISIPAAKIKIYGDPELCDLFLKPAFLFLREKKWDLLVARIMGIGVEHAFTYRIGTGFLDTSVAQTEIDMSQI